MRLLNTSTLSLHEFTDDHIPSYAILSYRWEGEEVTFQNLQVGRGPKMAGYSKIKGCYAQAALDGWQYAWIDSCCIDKTSSSELSEAINSMFRWYAFSRVYSPLSKCLASCGIFKGLPVQMSEKLRYIRTSQSSSTDSEIVKVL